ncbi:division/cell wall cluster transcriptional repressor MraZ [Mycoplasmopsis felifaucium]|uniref:Transcriptional regulator MraZ n=1 Tax=Mycoplasmopsis felifaucium TaxID=35768 RepID=A0ABZ2RP16_9BACT
MEIYGTYNRNVDDKNRIMIPAKLRDSLGSKFFMTIGLSGAVELRSETAFKKFSSKLLNQSQFSKEARILQRAWLGNSLEIELDSQGRFIIPRLFLEKSAIQKEAILIGVGELIELWGAEKYEEYCQSIDEDILEKAAEKLASKE